MVIAVKLKYLTADQNGNDIKISKYTSGCGLRRAGQVAENFRAADANHAQDPARSVEEIEPLAIRRVGIPMPALSYEKNERADFTALSFVVSMSLPHAFALACRQAPVEPGYGIAGVHCASRHTLSIIAWMPDYCTRA